ncbi:MAG: NUDIX domain-containing protein [Clostridia bacterium]|nr:NUDIX domain-containing protein [Clostridia bacterium]MDD4542381.1 NUDIX domain-containing protein [Clostridia bacterium]
MRDIIFHTDGYSFDYRVAGICVVDNKVLLQKPFDDTGYAFPGGHVSLGETNEETLMREIFEETGFDICVHELKWLGEIFFKWNGKDFQQICPYYEFSINAAIDSFSPFKGKEGHLMFYWVPIDKLDEILVYPPQAKGFLLDKSDKTHHFVYKE